MWKVHNSKNNPIKILFNVDVKNIHFVYPTADTLLIFIYLQFAN